MKKLLSILSLAVLILSCSETKERISFDMVTIVNGVCYLKADMSIVTGIATGSEDGMLMETNYKDGKTDGLTTVWFENGQLEGKVNYKDGKTDGLSKFWFENGQLKGEINFKDGKEDGLKKRWDINGHLEDESNYKDGELDGLSKTWHLNGQLQSEVNWKDGALIYIKGWNENGQIIN